MHQSDIVAPLFANHSAACLIDAAGQPVTFSTYSGVYLSINLIYSSKDETFEPSPCVNLACLEINSLSCQLFLIISLAIPLNIAKSVPGSDGIHKSAIFEV